jgi:Peptidase family M50
LSAGPPDVDAEVKARFRVTDTLRLPDGESEYRIAYEVDSGTKFASLKRALEPRGMTPWLTGTKDDCALTVRASAPVGRRASRVPVILVLLTAVSIVFFSIFERVTYVDYARGLPMWGVLVGYVASVVAVLGAHELGRRLWARRSGSAPPDPYLVPGIPYLTSVLPSLGFVSVQREPALNRDRLFDGVLAPPVFALAAAVVLYAAGGFLSVQSSQPLPSCQYTGSFLSVCPNAVQYLLDAVLGPHLPAVSAGYLRLSPVQDGASVGFLLTFIALLPMAIFDGGYLASLALGPRWARVATYLSVLALILIDTPFYWGVAIVVLLLAGRPIRTKFLDEVTELSRERRFVYLGALLLVLLVIPLPQSVAGFPLP